MLANLSERFSSIITKVRGFSRLTESNIGDTCDLIRDTLIDADVALPVVEQFIKEVRTKSLGHKVISSLRPGQAMIALVQQELTILMGEQAALLAKPSNEPTAILLSGLQGAGKTTTAAKLALLLKNQKRRVLVASIDVYRPAAIEQLEILCKEVKIDFHKATDDIADNPVERANQALKDAGQSLHDYVIIDTAGRNVIDEKMMEEIQQVSIAITPRETLLVIDSTLGQQALTVAKKFNEKLAITGICLTKLDGDARGGAAMSARAELGVPIKYIGVGERTTDLQVFDPERMASRILGMGDIVSLVENTTATMDDKKIEKLERKLKRKKTAGLELSDMIEQLRQADKMGGIDKVVDHLPSSMASKIKEAKINPAIFRRTEAMYLSMTHFERRNPHLIKGSRKARIALGSGVEVQQVNQLLVQHSQANKFMKKAAKNPIAAMNLMRGMFR